MKKLLLVVLVWMVLAGASRAGEMPADAKDAGPGMVTRAASIVRRIAMRIKGVWLGSLIRKGMAYEQVIEILGPLDGFSGGLSRMSCSFRKLGIRVVVNVNWDEHGFFFDRVISVELRWPLFD